MNIKRGLLNIIIGGISSGISLLSVSVSAYYLSKENFSALISLLAFLSILSPIALLGIGEMIVKYKNHRENQLIHHALVCVFIIQVLIAIFIIIIYSAKIKSYPTLELVGLLIIVSLFQIKSSNHRSENRYELAAFYSSMAFPLTILIAVYFYSTGRNISQDYNSIIILVIILSGIILTIDILNNNSLKNILFKYFKFEKISKVFIESIRIGYISFAYSMFMTLDIQFLSIYQPNNVGEYKINSIWTQFVLLPNIVFGAMLTNQLAKFIGENRINEVFTIIRKIQIIQIAGSIIISIIILALSHSIVIYVFDGKYQIDFNLIIIFIITGLILTVFGPEAVFLTYSNHQKYNIIILSLSVLLNIFILNIFIPKYGNIGAALSLLTSTIFWAFLVHRTFMVIKNKIKIY